MSDLIILRGLPGAGKNHYARTCGYYTRASCIVLSSDDHFEREGRWEFDWRQLGAAHGKVLRAAVRAITLDQPEVLVINNTNTRLDEIAPYVALAQAYAESGYGWTVSIIEIECDVETAVRRNVHGVPRSTIERMAANMEASAKDWPRHWPEIRRVKE